jgi:hypothetical protein
MSQYSDDETKYPSDMDEDDIDTPISNELESLTPPTEEDEEQQVAESQFIHNILNSVESQDPYFQPLYNENTLHYYLIIQRVHNLVITRCMRHFENYVDQILTQEIRTILCTWIVRMIVYRIHCEIEQTQVNYERLYQQYEAVVYDAYVNLVLIVNSFYEYIQNRSSFRQMLTEQYRIDRRFREYLESRMPDYIGTLLNNFSHNSTIQEIITQRQHEFQRQTINQQIRLTYEIYRTYMIQLQTREVNEEFRDMYINIFRVLYRDMFDELYPILLNQIIPRRFHP